MRLQRTLGEELVFEGKGLHTGRHAVVRLRPAPRNSGVVFYRSDKGVFINANINAVSDSSYATTIGVNGTSIKTVEHLLAAIAGLDIDNLIVEVDGPEIPILDGSATEFVQMIRATGVAKQSSNCTFIKVLKPIVFKEGNVEISAMPYEGRRLTYHIHYNHPLLKNQTLSIELDSENFTKHLAPARTFGFLKDVERLRSMGLARGGSLDNAIVLNETGVMNSSGLRFPDECIRHKMLDFVGDISLLGYPLYGHLFASRSGHRTNMKFVRKLLANPDCWQIVSKVEQSHGLAAVS